MNQQPLKIDRKKLLTMQDPIPLEKGLLKGFSGGLPIQFLGIGAQRAGTSWLFANLVRHPDIFLPFNKELHYFDLLHISNTADWYCEQFQEAGGSICGEITPSYSILEKTMIRAIASNTDQLKVFLIMRNPIDRAWSAIKMELQHLVGDRFALSQIPGELIVEHIKTSVTIEKGDYEKIIRNWRSAFSDDSLHLMFYEDIKKKPAQVLNGLFDFIGVPAVQDFSGYPLKKIVIKDPSGTMGEKKETAKEEMPVSVRRMLTNMYSAKIGCLSAFLGKDLSHWLS